MTDKFNENLKKAPQNAKYSVLRGIPLPAAGVEPAQGRRVYVRIAESCRNTFQIIRTSRECPRCCSRVPLPV